MRTLLLIFIFSLTMKSQVKLSYSGYNENIKTSVNTVNEIFRSNDFYIKILECKEFYGTKITPDMLANFIWGYDTTICISDYYKHNPFNSNVEYTKIVLPTSIKINTYDFTGKIERRTSILMREVFKLISIIYKHNWTCDENNPNKYNSIPYVVSDIAEKMVQYGFGYEEDLKIKEKWYLPNNK